MTPSDEIRNLLGTYCECMDSGDFEGIGALFARGALADEHGHPLAVGAEAVAAFYAAGTMLYDGSPRTKHLVSNSVFDLNEAAGTAVVRSSYVVLQQLPEAPLQPIIAGRYRDSFSHQDSAWHFVERRFLVDLLGDLSHHLNYVVG